MSSSADTPKNLTGQLLLADPSLRSEPFRKSVIFITEHNQEKGAYGLILNQSTDQSIGNLLPQKAFKELKNIKVYIGGPIDQEHLTFASFSVNDQKQLQLITRLTAENAVTHAQQPGTLVRAYAGYSAWTAGQLEDELEWNSWIPTPPVTELITSFEDKPLWVELLRNISAYHQILAEAPDDIFVN